MFLQVIGIVLLGTFTIHVECSGVFPGGFAVPGVPAVPLRISYTRAIPYNIPPFAAAVSFFRTGPKTVFAPSPALLPPHVHAIPRYAPVVPQLAPHTHAVPAQVHPGLGVGDIPAVVPHSASPLPHVGVLPGPVVPYTHHLAPLPLPLPHVAPAVLHAQPYLHAAHDHPVHAHSNFAPATHFSQLYAAGHGHVDPVHYHHHR